MTATNTAQHSTSELLTASKANGKSPKCSFLSSDLARFGPHCKSPSVLSVTQASEYCRLLAISHYENFSVASRLIPRKTRPHFYHIYAYCRWADDLADESTTNQEALERLDWWEIELERCFNGEATHPVFVALLSTLKTYPLRKQPFSDLLSAFRQDQSVNRYDTDSSLEDYCRRSANPVGRILLQLANVDSDRCRAWSDSICTSLQLINFAQDMSCDALMGRIYLPKSRWSRRGLSEQVILERIGTEPLRQTVLDWIAEIRTGFYSGWELTNHVPSWLSRDICLFAGGGLAIADAIAAKSGDVWSERVEVSKWSKLRILARAMITRRPPKPVHTNQKTRAEREPRHA